MDYSEACNALVEMIKDSDYTEKGTLMIMTFIDAIEADETPKMALTLAKKSIVHDTKVEMTIH